MHFLAIIPYTNRDTAQLGFNIHTTKVLDDAMSRLSINFCPSKILTSIVLTEAKCHFRVRTQFKKMPATLNKASPIIGMTGVLCAAAIVSIFGMSHVRWSFLMVVMAGSALFWMENLQRCIQAEVRREDRTHLVRVRRTPHSDYQNSGSNSYCTFFLRSKMISSACISRRTLTSEKN